MRFRKDILEWHNKLDRPIMPLPIEHRRFLNIEDFDYQEEYKKMYLNNVGVSVTTTRRLGIRRIRKTRNFRVINDSFWNTEYLQKTCRRLADIIGIDWAFIFEFYTPQSIDWGGQTNCFNRFECGLHPNDNRYPSKFHCDHGYDLLFKTKEHHLEFIVAHEMCHVSAEGHPENFVLSDGKIDTDATEKFAIDKPLEILQKST